MKRFMKLLALILLFSLVPLQTSQAWTMPAPSWVNELKLPSDFSWGNWLACLPEYREFDCIESVYWVKSDSEKVPGIWKAKPNFDYKSFTSEWVKHPDGYDLQYMKEGIFGMGGFHFEGLVTPCKSSSDEILFDVRAAQGSFQLNALSPCNAFFSEKFEERFEITLKSQNLKGIVGGVSSNGRSPSITFAEKNEFGFITLSAKFAYIPWNSGDNQHSFLEVCKQNQERARTGGWGLWNSIFFVDRPWGADELLRENPADVITGTNGWNCGGTLRWDPREGALVMEVGAPHYDVDGSVVEGWFEGSIRGRYVKSRFGITPEQAAGNARLEVVYTSGEVKIATISATYDLARDIISFNSNGFTYSAPTLKLTFGKNPNTKDPVETESKPIKSSQPIKEVVKKLAKKTTCVKGNRAKKVSTTNCPKGYKKS